MDTLSEVIIMLFHDYPIAEAYGMIVESDKKSNFMSSLCEVANDFYGAEAKAHVGKLKKECENRGYRKENLIQLFVGAPSVFAEEVLTKDKDDYACVEFQKLLRWRDVVKHTGEDLFTISFLAKNDTGERKDFSWPNVIAHNREELNAVLNDGLADIHSHFGGSVYVQLDLSDERCGWAVRQIQFYAKVVQSYRVLQKGLSVPEYVELVQGGGSHTSVSV